MAYYVDTGAPRIAEAETKGAAETLAQLALQAAEDFRAKRGFVPYWGRAVEIRKGPKDLGAYVFDVNAANAEILAGSKLVKVLALPRA